MKLFYKKGIIKLFTEKACQIFKKLFIYLWLFWVLIAAQASLAVMTGGYSNRSVQSMDLRAPRLQELRHVGLIAPLPVLPGSGIESMSTALGGGFFTTEPPGKPYFSLNKNHLKQSKDLVRSGACPSLTGCWKQFGDPPGCGERCSAMMLSSIPHAQTLLPAQA